MSNVGAAPCAAVPAINARVEASRKNGAKSKGPKTPEGKERSAQNALKHGFRAQKHIVLPGENAAEFAALEAALMEELAPDGVLQCVLAQRVVAATWRLARAERLEAQLFAENHLAGRSLGLALIRDCNGARAFDTLLRYRGGTLAELWRALRTLKALQAERQEVREAARTQQPDEPECRGNPDDSDRPDSQMDEPTRNPALAWPFPTPAAPAPWVQPIEPKTRGNAGSGPRSPRAAIGQKSERGLLAGTALVPLGRPGPDRS